MFDKLLNDFLEGFDVSELKSALKFLNDAETYKVSIKEDGDNVHVTTNKEMTDDEYKEYVDGVLATWKTVSSLVSDNNFVVYIKVGNRPEDVYKYNKDKGSFEVIEANPEDKTAGKIEPYVMAKTENKGASDSEKYKLNVKDLLKKYNNSNTKFEVKDNSKEEVQDAPVSFAQDLKARIDHEIAEGYYDDIFDVDYAMEQIKDVFDDGSYDVIWEGEKAIGIAVPVEYLTKEFDGLNDDARAILEGEGKNVFAFVNRCISELGFSNVVPEYNKVDNDYTGISFKFYF